MFVVVVIKTFLIEGVITPALYLVDYNRRSLFMQYIENACMLKTFIDQNIVGKEAVSTLVETISTAVGNVISKLHSKCIVHGDLTTSNILLMNETDVINAQSKTEGELKLNIIYKLPDVKISVF